jgi:hypothetical protein
MIKINGDDRLVIETDMPAEGSMIEALHRALVKGIEEISCCERAGNEEYKDAVYHLSELLRACLLTPSQYNLAVGKRPYRDDIKKVS